MGKTYRQPKLVEGPRGGGYPETGINKDGIMVKGRWPAGTKTKTRKAMRGKGAATRGYMFYDED
jgi:hypothetical protein